MYVLCTYIYIYIYHWYPHGFHQTPGRFKKQGEQHKTLHQQGGKNIICANLLGRVDRHDESDDWDFKLEVPKLGVNSWMVKFIGILY